MRGCDSVLSMRTHDAHKMAIELMNQHGLGGWKFQFDRGKVRFGYCNWKRRTISLSQPLTNANDVQEVRNTILHEIAHALDMKEQHLNGWPKGWSAHGPSWKRRAIKVGANPTACYTSNEVNAVEPKYWLVCPNCGDKRPRYRKTNTAFSCASCCNRYNHGVYSENFRRYWVEN